MVTSLQIPKEALKDAQSLVSGKEQEFKDQFGLKEQQLSLTLEKSSSPPSTVLTRKDAELLIALLLIVPHGVAKMSHAVSGITSILDISTSERKACGMIA